MAPPSVTWISVAPVKGLALLQRDEVRLERSGVTDDRRFHLISPTGRLLNGKQLAPLVQVTPDWVEESGFLSLRFPDGTVVADIIELGEPVATDFYQLRDVRGRLVVGPWSDALSDFLGQPVRLVQPERQNDGTDRGPGIVTILSTGSLDALRDRAGLAEAIDPRRFRMLFGVDGVDRHEEDSWKGRTVQIGQAEVHVRGNVGRCIVTSRHPETGARTLATLDLLAEYREDVETTEPLPFGVWGTVATPGRVRLGDQVVPPA